MSLTTYTILIYTAGILLLGIGIYFLKQPNKSKAQLWFMATLLLCAFYNLFYGLEVSLAALDAKVLAHKLRMTPLMFVPATYLVTVFYILGKERWLTRGLFCALYFLPAVCLVLLWAPDWAVYFRSGFAAIEYPSGKMLYWKNGVWFKFYYAYVLAMSFASLGLILLQVFIGDRRKRVTHFILFIIFFIPILLDIFFVLFDTQFVEGGTVTPFGFLFTGVVLSFYLSRDRSLQIFLDAARGTLMDHPSLLMFAFDDTGKVLDSNQCFKQVFEQAHDLKSMPEEFYQTWERFKKSADAKYSSSLQVLGKYYQLTMSKISNADANSPSCYLAILHDVDALVRTQTELAETHRLLEKKATEQQVALRYYAREGLKIRDRERHRISRELHDVVGQKMTAATLLIEGHKQHLSKVNAVDTLKNVERIQQMVDETLKVTRELCFQLSPPLHASNAFPKSLANLVDEFLVATENSVHVECINELENRNLRDDLYLGFYRILREFLTNVARHAHANKVVIKFAEDKTAYRIELSDDGVGFEVEKALNDNTLGLANIRERVFALGGECTIHSSNGKGTRFGIIIPKSKYFN